MALFARPGYAYVRPTPDLPYKVQLKKEVALKIVKEDPCLTAYCFLSKNCLHG